MKEFLKYTFATVCGLILTGKWCDQCTVIA